MYRSFFKVAWRNLKNNKFFSAINIMGLAAGMAVALIIGLWVYEEYSYNKFLPEYQRTYRVQRNFNDNGDTLTFRSTSLRLAEALRQEIPEIEYVAESDWMGQHGLISGETKIYINGGQVGSDFLKVLKYPLLKGNENEVLKDPYSIVLTESTAKSLFGSQDPLGKMVKYDNKNDLKVTGVLKDIPDNSTLKFNFLVPFSYLEQINPNIKANRTGSFGANSYQIFVKLKPGIAYAQVGPKLRVITHGQKDNFNAINSYVTLQSIGRWHLYSNYKNGQDTEGYMEYVRMFSIIGILVLLIACINFINLTTARSGKRAREIGVRKTIGSDKKSLILQFMAESFVFTFLAFVISLLIVILVLPAFNTLTANQIRIPFGNPVFWLLMAGCVLLTTVLAGSSPAFYLSSFKPVKVLKGTMTTGKTASLPRKVLVVLQFSCSVALIISTIIIYQQINHAKNRPTGYDTTRVVMTNLNNDLSKNFEALKNEMIEKRIAENVTTASSPATDIYWHSSLDWPGKHPGENIEMGTVITTDNYFKTLGITFSAGRDFIGSPDSTNVIFNETALRQMRITEPLGKQIKFGDDKFTIVGVVKDALMVSPYASAEPMMFFHADEAQGNILYKLSPQIKTQDAIAQLTTLFNKHSPAFPYKYQFADESYADKFKLEVLIGKLAGIFATLAVLISCLGLFGLAVYMAEQRTKEVGIRKVLGASVLQIWLLLSSQFIFLVLISCVIASPVAFYFLQNWLQKYEYKISIGPYVFVLAAVTAILITILTVSFQAIRSALANPVRSLRTE